MPPSSFSVPDPEPLRRFSPAAARLCAARPRLLRFLVVQPTFEALDRLPADRPDLCRRCLRLMRMRVFVHTAWAEAQGGSPLAAARLWTAFADAALRAADRVAMAEVVARHGASLDRQGRPVGRALFGLGKLGSGELNPSSDVDLLLCYGTDEGSAGAASLHEVFTAWARRVRALLADVDEDGFAFRVDYDLRPEGSTGPLVNSVDALESYYERFGLTWERAALLRLRPIVDVGGVADEVVKRLRPFVFRKSIGFTAIDELFAMKQRVTAEAKGRGFDVKRGQGGIREVEFVAQSCQLLFGGRIPELQRGSTSEILAVLEEKGLVPHRAARGLRESYELLRRVEHALQYAEDRQTHTLPESGPALVRVARAVTRLEDEARAGEALRLSLKRHRDRVHRVFQRVLGEARDAPSDEARRALDRAAADDERAAALAALGFSDAARAFTLLRMAERRRGSPFSPRSLAERPERAVQAAFLLEEIASSPDPMTALARLPDVFGARVHKDLLDRLGADRRLTALLVRLLATSAPLSRLFVRHAGLETVLLQGEAGARWSRRAVRERLRENLDPDEEEPRLVRMRVVQGRLTLPVGIGFFAGRIGVVEAGHRLSVLADAILDEALDLAARKIRRRHGELPGGRFVVCAQGSLGGRELGFFRDLDLSFVYEGEGETTGPKVIGASEWASRTAQQVLWALQAPLAEGPCFLVDARLRPSGNQGALTVSLPRFRAYHAGDSALWERQALLRLRPVAGDRDLGRDVVAAARAAAFRAWPERLGARLLEMRARMVAERTSQVGGSLDLKLGAGGIADVEFAVQGALLAYGPEHPELWSSSTRRSLARLARRGFLNEEDAATLRRGLDELQYVREALALVDDTRAPAVTRGDHRLDLVARARLAPGGFDGGPALFDRLVEQAGRVREVSERILLRLGG